MKWEKGTPLKAHTKPAFTREHLKKYANASGDHNRIHLEDSFAKEAGFPTVIVHGMLSMGCLADIVKLNFPESEYDLLRFKGRFRKVTFPDDALTLEGEIKTVNDNGDLTVSVWAKNQADEIKIDGEADIRPKGRA